MQRDTRPDAQSYSKYVCETASRLMAASMADQPPSHMANNFEDLAKACVRAAANLADELLAHGYVLEKRPQGGTSRTGMGLRR
jgi:hypothetical protein